jgi:uncharacterized membrane protein
VSEAVYGFVALVILILGVWKAIEVIVKIARYTLRVARREKISDEDEALRKKIEEKLKFLKKKKRS